MADLHRHTKTHPSFVGIPGAIHLGHRQRLTKQTRTLGVILDVTAFAGPPGGTLSVEVLTYDPSMGTLRLIQLPSSRIDTIAGTGQYRLDVLEPVLDWVALRWTPSAGVSYTAQPRYVSDTVFP